MGWSRVEFRFLAGRTPAKQRWRWENVILICIFGKKSLRMESG
jgi:hypothetical protein